MNKWTELISEAERLYKKCGLCPWKCKVNRFEEEGKCRAKNYSRVFYQGILYGEEINISPCYGIFFAGCNLKCIFCECGQFQANPQLARRASIKGMINSLREYGTHVRSLQFIGGEPSLHVLSMLKIMQGIRGFYKPMAVLNTNMYFSEAARPFLDEIADTFLADYHFGNDACAYTLSGARDYCAVVSNNIQWALEKHKQVIVRHLVMPGHLECCMIPVVDYVKELPGVQFSALFNYYPCFEAIKDVRMKRRLNKAEKETAIKLLERNNMQQASGIVQECCDANPSGKNETEVIIDQEGRIIIQYVTADMLRLACELNPENKEFALRKKILLGDK